MVKNGTPTPTPLPVRVLSAQLRQALHRARSKSPIVGPEKPPAPPKPAERRPERRLRRRRPASTASTPTTTTTCSPTRSRSQLRLDPCKADTDGDGVEDGYEYQSAKDLNDDEYQTTRTRTCRTRRKRPYPNPLDGTDADIDHDGDTLTLSEEYGLWKYTIAAAASRATLDAADLLGRQAVLAERAVPAAGVHPSRRGRLRQAGRSSSHWAGRPRLRHRRARRPR